MRRAGVGCEFELARVVHLVRLVDRLVGCMAAVCFDLLLIIPSSVCVCCPTLSFHFHSLVVIWSSRSISLAKGNIFPLEEKRREEESHTDTNTLQTSTTSNTHRERERKRQRVREWRACMSRFTRQSLPRQISLNQDFPTVCGMKDEGRDPTPLDYFTI